MQACSDRECRSKFQKEVWNKETKKKDESEAWFGQASSECQFMLGVCLFLGFRFAVGLRFLFLLLHAVEHLCHVLFEARSARELSPSVEGHARQRFRNWSEAAYERLIDESRPVLH